MWKWITSTVKLEEAVFGHLTELNGKYKMRATEVTFAPGAIEYVARIGSRQRSEQSELTAEQ